jgi:hypothetical protein
VQVTTAYLAGPQHGGGCSAGSGQAAAEGGGCAAVGGEGACKGLLHGHARRPPAECLPRLCPGPASRSLLTPCPLLGTSTCPLGPCRILLPLQMDSNTLLGVNEAGKRAPSSCRSGVGGPGWGGSAAAVAPAEGAWPGAGHLRGQGGGRALGAGPLSGRQDGAHLLLCCRACMQPSPAWRVTKGNAVCQHASGCAAQVFIPDAPADTPSSVLPGASSSAAAPTSAEWQLRGDADTARDAAASISSSGARGGEANADAMPEWWNPSPALHVSLVYKQEVRSTLAPLCAPCACIGTCAHHTCWPTKRPGFTSPSMMRSHLKCLEFSTTHHVGQHAAQRCWAWAGGAQRAPDLARAGGRQAGRARLPHRLPAPPAPG